VILEWLSVRNQVVQKREKDSNSPNVKIFGGLVSKLVSIFHIGPSRVDLVIGK
jgi:hypothetical protein